jgi:hypothetical protein
MEFRDLVRCSLASGYRRAMGQSAVLLSPCDCITEVAMCYVLNIIACVSESGYVWCQHPCTVCTDVLVLRCSQLLIVQEQESYVLQATDLVNVLCV